MVVDVARFKDRLAAAQAERGEERRQQVAQPARAHAVLLVGVRVALGRAQHRARLRVGERLSPVSTTATLSWMRERRHTVHGARPHPSA